jgi:hypothetical protein
VYTLRRAGAEDLPVIYQSLNTPLREKFLVEPLPAESLFLQQSEIELKSGREFYYLLEQDGVVSGLIRIMVPVESCEIWGRSLATLYYHCGRIAFEQLGMNRLQWYVRQNNRRMIRICEMFGAEKTGESPFFNLGDKLSFIAIGILNFYEFTPENYRSHLAIMQRYALPISNISEKITD